MNKNRSVYKNQIWFSSDSYEDLNAKPLIESVELEGNHDINYYNIYDKGQVIDLIKNASSIKVVSTKPTLPNKNTLYYVGTKNPYDLYFYTAVRKEFYLGATAFTSYVGSEGVVVDTLHNIKLDLDPATLRLNSAQELEANTQLFTGYGIQLDGDVINVVIDEDYPDNVLMAVGNDELWLDWMVGADADTDGKHGVAFAPSTSMRDFSLMGDGSWQDFTGRRGVIGEIRAFARDPMDATWLPCDGRLVSSATYPELYRRIGTAYGGDATNFALPDTRERCLEGYGLTQRSLTNGRGGTNIITRDLPLGTYAENGAPNATGRTAQADAQGFNHASGGPTGPFRGAGGSSSQWSALNNGNYPAPADHMNTCTTNYDAVYPVWSKEATKLQLRTIRLPYYIKVKY